MITEAVIILLVILIVSNFALGFYTRVEKVIHQKKRRIEEPIQYTKLEYKPPGKLCQERSDIEKKQLIIDDKIVDVDVEFEDKILTNKKRSCVAAGGPGVLGYGCERDGYE